MVDENGANYWAIRKVFGLEFATSKVVSCQMHYKNDVNRASLKIGNSYKDVFKNICHKMCSVTTVTEYNDRKKWLQEIANIFPQISSWINWWDVRKYHIFPAFRQLGYSNVTLAESGNSTLKWCTQLWLLEAVCNDTSTMLTQIHEVKSFWNSRLLQAAEDHAHWVMKGPILKPKYMQLEHMLPNSITMKLVLWPYRKIQTHRSLYHPVV